jgi:hypothetical protein
VGGVVFLVALFIVAGVVLGTIAFVAYRRVLRRAKGVERGLKMVPLLIHLPPPSDDVENSGTRTEADVMRARVAEAQSLYDLLAGTAQTGFKSNFYGQRHIAFEIIANAGLVHYFAAVPIALVSVVEQALVTAYPGARLEEVEDHNIFNPQGHLTGTVGGELVLKHEAAYPIATIDKMEKDPMVGLINSLYKLQQGDGAAVQIMLRPARTNWTKRSIKLVAGKRHTRQGGLGFGVLDIAKGAVKTSEEWREKGKTFEVSKLEEDSLQAIEEKTKHPGYEVLIRVLASSPTYDRSQMLLRAITTSFALFDAPASNGFQFIEGRDMRGLVTAFIFRFFPPELTSTVLSSPELAALFHLPDAQFTPTSQVQRQQSKQVDGPVNMPTSGLLLGYNFYRGVKKEVRLSEQDRRRHTYIIGQTGTGKSTILENLAVQDMLAGNGFAFIDPHGDTAEKLISMVPKERAEDIIYFNPGDMDRPLGLNLFEFNDPTQKDFLIQESINMLYKLYDPTHQGIIGPRFEHWFRNAALTLMADPNGASFIEIPKVFTDSAYLKNKFKYLTDPTVIDFWTKEMGQTSDYHKSEMLGFFVSKFGAFQSNEMMRNIIGQTHSAFNLREVMDNKKILIVNLGKGRVGELNAQLLGMMFVMKFQAAAMSRSSVPEDQRQDFCLYVDEFQNFSTDSFASILSEARKYRLNLIVANQFIGQLSDEIRDAVFGNVGTMISYRTGPEDAEFLVKQFQPVFDERDLVNLPNYNAVMKLLTGGLPSQPFSITALPPLGQAHAEMGLAVQQLSAAKYGVARATVEADIFARLQNQPATVVPNAATAALTPPVAAPATVSAPATAPATAPVTPPTTPPPAPVSTSAPTPSITTPPPAPAAPVAGPAAVGTPSVLADAAVRPGTPPPASPATNPVAQAPTPAQEDLHAAMLPPMPQAFQPSPVSPPTPTVSAAPPAAPASSVVPAPTAVSTPAPTPLPPPVPTKPPRPASVDELSLSQLSASAPVPAPADIVAPIPAVVPATPPVVAPAAPLAPVATPPPLVTPASPKPPQPSPAAPAPVAAPPTPAPVSIPVPAPVQVPVSPPPIAPPPVTPPAPHSAPPAPKPAQAPSPPATVAAQPSPSRVAPPARIEAHEADGKTNTTQPKETDFKQSAAAPSRQSALPVPPRTPRIEAVEADGRTQAPQPSSPAAPVAPAAPIVTPPPPVTPLAPPVAPTPPKPPVLAAPPPVALTSTPPQPQSKPVAAPAIAPPPPVARPSVPPQAPPAAPPPVPAPPVAPAPTPAPVSTPAPAAPMTSPPPVPQPTPAALPAPKPVSLPSPPAPVVAAQVSPPPAPVLPSTPKPAVPLTPPPKPVAPPIPPVKPVAPPAPRPPAPLAPPAPPVPPTPPAPSTPTPPVIKKEPAPAPMKAPETAATPPVAPVKPPVAPVKPTLPQPAPPSSNPQPRTDPLSAAPSGNVAQPPASVAPSKDNKNDQPQSPAPKGRPEEYFKPYNPEVRSAAAPLPPPQPKPAEKLPPPKAAPVATPPAPASPSSKPPASATAIVAMHHEVAAWRPDPKPESGPYSATNEMPANPEADDLADSGSSSDAHHSTPVMHHKTRAIKPLEDIPLAPARRAALLDEVEAEVTPAPSPPPPPPPSKPIPAPAPQPLPAVNLVPDVKPPLEKPPIKPIEVAPVAPVVTSVKPRSQDASSYMEAATPKPVETTAPAMPAVTAPDPEPEIDPTPVAAPPRPGEVVAAKPSSKPASLDAPAAAKVDSASKTDGKKADGNKADGQKNPAVATGSSFTPMPKSDAKPVEADKPDEPAKSDKSDDKPDVKPDDKADPKPELQPVGAPAEPKLAAGEVFVDEEGNIIQG